MSALVRIKAALTFSAGALPQGVAPVGAGLLVNGLTAYGFLIVSARAVGPEQYASLSVLWALIFLLGPGLFLPVEQEVGRALSARGVRGWGGRPVVRRAAIVGGCVAAVLLVGSLAFAEALLDQLFDGQVLLLTGLSVGLVGYAFQYLSRGTLSGNSRFRPYGLLLGTEGVVRLAVGIGLAVAGIEFAGPYGLAVGFAPFVAIAVGLRKQRGLLSSGPEAPWSELTGALGYLLAGSLLAQGLVNAGPIAVKLLAAATEQAAAGRFLAGLVIARIPVFLFQAVQASLLPKLSQLAASGRHLDFRTGLKQLLVVVLVVGVIATVGAWAIGPWVVRFLFGPQFDLTRSDLGYLAGGSAAYMIALALAQALIALSGYARAALGWLIGVLAFLTVIALQGDLLLRVERGYLVGAVAAAIGMGLLLIPRLPGAGTPAEPLIEASHEVPIEP